MSENPLIILVLATAQTTLLSHKWVHRPYNKPEPCKAEHVTVRLMMMKRRLRCVCLVVIWVMVSSCGNGSPVWDGNCDSGGTKSHTHVAGLCELLQRARHRHHKPPWDSKPLYQIAAANNLTLIALLLQTCTLLHYIIRLLVCLCFIVFVFPLCDSLGVKQIPFHPQIIMRMLYAL